MATPPSARSGPDFSAVFQQLPGLFLILDGAERVVAASDDYVASLESPRDRVVGRPLRELLTSSFAEWDAGMVGLVCASAERVLRTGTPESVSFTPPVRSGSDDRGAAPRVWQASHRRVDAADDRGAYVLHQLVTGGSDPQGGDAGAVPPQRAAEAADADRAATSLEPSTGDEPLSHYRDVLSAIDEAFCVVEVIFDQTEKPVDFRFLEVNAGFERHTGLEGVVGRRMRELAPLQEERWFEIFGKVTLTGDPVRFESHSAPLQRWFRVHAVRIGRPEQRRVALLFADITQRKNAEQLLRNRESELRRAQSAAHLGSWRWDIAANTAAWSEEMYRIFGLPVSFEPSPEAVLSSLHPEDRERFMRIVGAVRERGEITPFEVRLVRPDGAQRTLLVTAFDLERDTAGRPVVLFGTVLDITDQQRSEEALRTSEERLRLFIEHAPAALAMFDRQMRYLSSSRRWQRDYGLEADELVGRSHYDVFPEIPERWREIHRRALSGEVISSNEDAFERSNGTTQWLRWEVRPWYDPSRQIAGVVVFTEDITARKHAELALQESEARFGTVADNIPQLAWMTDAAGRILWFNRRWYDYTGRSLEQMQAEGWSSVHNPQRPQAIAEGWNRALQTGEPWEDTFELRGRDGDYRWFLSRAFPIRDATGRISRWFGTNTDITDLRETQEALKKARDEAQTRAREAEQRGQLIEAMMEHIPMGITVASSADPDSRLTSRHGRELLAQHTANADPQAPSDRPTWAVLHPDGVTCARPEELPLTRTLRGEFVRGEEWILARGDSSRIPLLCIGAPIRDRTGAITGGVVGWQDITERKRAEQALAVAKVKLERHARELEETVAERTATLRETVEELEAFSYSLSHDMRAPLRAMKGFSQILLAEYGDRLDAQARLYLERIGAAAGRLDQLIQDVLAYSQVVRGQVDLHPIDTERLLHQLIDENPALQPPKAEIAVNAPLCPVLGHEAYLMQVVSNLVYNAVKFVVPGQQPRVRIWTEPADAHVRLFVQDNGIGIPSEARQRLFGMFQRFHSDMAYEGTGIGLAIVRKAVERMGGSISVESEPGRGSTFIVVLRRAPS